MRVDRVGDLSIFVLEKEDAKGEGEEEEVEYRSWVSMGDFFHLLLAETTPTNTWRELTGGERKEGGGGAATTTTITMGDRKRLIPLLVGLKIMREINQEGTSTKADRVLKMFQDYLHQHVKDLERDYDTEEEEEEGEGKEGEKGKTSQEGSVR
jgi:hypothetical protein